VVRAEVEQRRPARIDDDKGTTTSRRVPKVRGEAPVLMVPPTGASLDWTVLYRSDSLIWVNR
jgi:hypothetical protein